MKTVVTGPAPGFRRRVSRFRWGLCVDVQPPDLETRTAILQLKAERDHIVVPAEVIEFAASIGHLRLVLRPGHALEQFVHIGQHLLLFLAQAFQFASKLFTFLIGNSFAHR